MYQSWFHKNFSISPWISIQKATINFICLWGYNHLQKKYLLVVYKVDLTCKDNEIRKLEKKVQQEIELWSFRMVYQCAQHYPTLYEILWWKHCSSLCCCIRVSVGLVSVDILKSYLVFWQLPFLNTGAASTGLVSISWYALNSDATSRLILDTAVLCSN